MSHPHTKTLWDRRHLRMALEVASWSKDPSSQVGAVIIDARRSPISWGYNGFPRGIRDTEDRLNIREQKYPRIVHAEANALLLAPKADLQGCTLYSTHAPCAKCAGMIIQKGISRVVWTIQLDYEARWEDELRIAQDMLYECNIPFSGYDNPHDDTPSIFDSP